MPIRDKVRGKIGQPRVPEWADDENEEIEGDIRPTREAALEKAFPPHEEEKEEVDTTPIVRKDDHLLLRRAELVFVPTTEEEARRREGLGLEEEEEDDEEEEEEKGEELSVWRPVFVPKIREGLELEGEDEEEDALAERRRRQIKEKNEKLELAFSRELAMAKPGFVPNRKRCTIAEREPLEAEEGALEEAKKRRLGSKDKESQKNMELEANVADVDTDDELNEAEEYEAWKVREVRRIKLDREVREAMLKVRNMTKEVMREWDREVREAMLKMRNMRKEVMREWERKNPEPVTLSKQKWIYMHKGAFFRSDPDDRTVKGTGNIFAPYFSAPTGEDKMDKTILPKGMQVKNSGRSGRTKWAHLVNEDNTDWNNPWAYNDPLRAMYNEKMAAMNAPVTKPKGSRKLKTWEPR